MTNLIERLRIDYHDPTCGVYSVRQICDCTNHARREAADALEAAEAKLKEEKQFASQLCEKLQMAEAKLAQAQEHLLRAVGHLKDMLKQDDGQAYQEAERFIASIEESAATQMPASASSGSKESIVNSSASAADLRQEQERMLEQIATEFERMAARDKALAEAQTGLVGFGVTASFSACWLEAARFVRSLPIEEKS